MTFLLRSGRSTGLVALAMVLLFATASARAQINTEKMRIAEEVEGFTTTAAANVAFRTGNVDVLDIGLGGRVDYRAERFSAFLTGSTQFSRAEDSVFLDEAFAHLRATLRLPGREWIRPEVFVQTQRDASQLLTRRYLAGAGLRLALLSDTSTAVFLGSTPMMEYELLNRDRVPQNPETTVVRWSSYLVLKFEISDLVTFVHTIYVQPRFDRFGDVRILDEAGLDVQITEALGLRVTLDLRYDSDPPADLDRFDLVLRNGLRLDF